MRQHHQTNYKNNDHVIELLQLDEDTPSNSANVNSLVQLCSMCGDVGFREELFRCSSCRNRLQHRYCSTNYWSAEEIIRDCEWCLHAKRRNIGVTRSPAKSSNSTNNRGPSKFRGFSNTKNRTAMTVTRRCNSAHRPATFAKKQETIERDTKTSVVTNLTPGAGNGNGIKPFLQLPAAGSGTNCRRFRSLHDVLCSSC